ncbi:MAG: glycosyltransferase, partial [Bacteroidota bacterium]|nr:glycosyltransferase [Bacteroidota bacterium]
MQKKEALRNTSVKTSTTFVSVIICAKNEEENLRINLPLIFDQNYADFEVIVVDDGSVDNTLLLLNNLTAQYPNLKFISISRDEKIGIGKKYALQRGVQKAKGDVVLLTDADCKPASQHWIREMASLISNQHKIVLGISPYEKRNTFLNALIEYETAHTALQYIGFTLWSHTYMSVGRNVCYDKILLSTKSWTNKELSIASGDDDLTIQTLATPVNTTVSLSPESYTISEPKENWRDWLKQKLRHYESGNLYRSSHKLFLGGYLLTKLLLYILAVYFIAVHVFAAPTVILILLHTVLITLVNFILQKHLRLNSRWIFAVIFD